MENTIKEIKSKDGKAVSSVILKDGTELKADLVLIGVGVKPNTDFLKGTSIKMEKDGGLTCNPYLQTSDPNIFAAGDIASYPYWVNGKRQRVEHWVVAGD